MRKRIVAAMLTCALAISSSTAQTLGAVEVTDPPEPPYYASMFVSGFQLSDQIDVIELYNESSSPLDLSSWSVQYPSLVIGEVCKITFQDWLPPESYVVAVASGGASASLLEDNKNVRSYESCKRSLEGNFSLTLYNNDIMQETISPTSGAFVRKGLTKTYRTGKFGTDFIAINRGLYAGEWYQPPDLLQLQISEILINSRNCSPLEIAVECSDYVKLYNPTDQVVDLSNFRMRNGYLGQSSTASNTLLLDGLIEPGHYMTIPMTVTNSAGWLWLEDYYGVRRYDNTVQDYPDGSSDTKKGQAWAYDIADGAWKWTSQPTSLDAPSFFPVPPPEPPPVPVVAVLAPCKDGQYRSEETNRCRSVVSAVASLVACDEGQERNPETNRCRSVLGETSTLTPCAEGQERNPETNRCRNIVSSIPEAGFAIEPIQASSSDLTGWWAFGGVSALALGYAGWEWRVEASRILGKVTSFFHSAK